jgi:DNA-binding Lrp family transcriptional regulator
MTVLIHISLQTQSEQQLEAFEAAVSAAPSIIGCQLMSGEDDYVLTVLARDLADYERIHKQELSRLPSVARLRSSFVLRDVKSRPIPESALAIPRAAASRK